MTVIVYDVCLSYADWDDGVVWKEGRNIKLNIYMNESLIHTLVTNQ